MLCEQLIPTFIGLVMAYSALFILIGTMNPTPSDSLAIFLLELHDGLPLPCARPVPLVQDQMNRTYTGGTNRHWRIKFV